MAPSHKDESVSPMTRTPNNTSPSPSDNAQRPYSPPNGALNLLPPLSFTPGLGVDDTTTKSFNADGDGGPAKCTGKESGENALTENRKASAPNGTASMAPAAQSPPSTSPNGRPSESQSPSESKFIQFAPVESPGFQPGHARTSSWDGPDTPGKSRGGSIMSKLKSSFAATSGSQSPKATSSNASQDPSTPSLVNPPSTPNFGGSRLPQALPEEQSDADADADADVETADEANIQEASPRAKRKRRMRRFIKGEQFAPLSPGPLGHEMESAGTYNRLLRRRASMPDTSITDHVLSEGEGREQARRRPFVRRGYSWVQPTTIPPGEELDGMESSAVIGRRHGHTRRITVFGGGGMSDGDAMTPRRPFFHSERASTYGAAKWKQVKNTLKMLRQKKEDRFDYFKSAELMAELRAGAPAVLMLASMIQRDEHGNKRIPVLLEQLKLSIKDSQPMPDDDKERHWLFTIQLEYGSGPSRMVWTVTRTIRDIYNLHFRYKFALNNDKYMLGRELGARPKQPKFPYSAFPYLRGARNKDDSSDEEEQPTDREGDMEANDAIPEDGGEGAESRDQDHGDEAAHDGSEGPRQHRRKRSMVNMLGIRRRSTGQGDPDSVLGGDGNDSAEVMRQRYVDKQRRILEKYLSEMVRWLMFRADSNRLCRFLELSALGVRLAAEGSYHGKEGYLHIQSSKGLDFRRVLTPAKVIARHSRKWFLVRQSYIVCVDSPENMNIYDVYLVDSKFSIVSKRSTLKQIASKNKPSEIDLTVEAPPDKHHTLTLQTSERKVRLFSRYQSVMKQFEESMSEMLRETVWHEKKRFDSFAPVRNHVFAQWLVDGRDYMWNVSRAINMAKDVIYIHDWWLSPELYMRRPAAISQKWRLDRLLQKKAREGVKVFVIVYRNVEAAIPIDSEYTKFSLLNLHPNIFVQRSPNQFKKNQFFFAHHEKICIVDHDVAFLGGIDLCFGRWDCPQHPIVDDKPTGFEQTEQPKDAEHCQLFPGKDYSNPRVQDFFRLNEPYEEMYDRSKVPRMPWHDVAMQVVGQPARDLTRHFVQRWNYLRRGRKSTRPLPFLLPPPEAKLDELDALGLAGTCEVQMLRSASNWSLGIDETEHSIQTAYIKMIEESDHFVYMENQFFISSTEVYNTKISNRIGDALVNRIIRAYENGENWRCVIVIPLMPGFQNTVDEQEGTSVRLILMCQYRSICRGEHSIFGRLRAAGIEPSEYIDFFSLRQWGIMSNDVLVTEQLYIHAKTIIVDDRVALIGSANINERSMLGTRDSECAAIVRDTDMISSTMGGEPYEVGRFAHTLRMRLMREHLGLDVDEILEQERQQDMEREDFEQRLDEMYAEDPMGADDVGTSSQHAKQSVVNHGPRINHELDEETAAKTRGVDTAGLDGKGKQKLAETQQHARDVEGYGPDHWKSAEDSGQAAGRDSAIVNGKEVLVSDVSPEGKGTLNNPKPPKQTAPAIDNRYVEPANTSAGALPPIPPFDRRTTEQLGLPGTSLLPSLPVVDDTDIGGPPVHIDPQTGRPKSGAFHPIAADIKLADINKDCMRDPVNSNFIDEVWNRVARNNTKLYRRVFRCMPDSAVSTWAEYREYVDYGKRFKESMEGKPSADETEPKRETTPRHASQSGAIGVAAPSLEGIAQATGHDPKLPDEKLAEKIFIPGEDDQDSSPKQSVSNEKQSVEDEKQGDTEKLSAVPFNADGRPVSNTNRERKTTFSNTEKKQSKEANNAASAPVDSAKRRRRATTKGSKRWSMGEEMPSRADAEELLKMVQGNLVQFPYDWLLTEEHNGNWGYQVDGVAPLAIYN